MVNSGYESYRMTIKIRQKLKHKTPFNHMVLPQAILLNSCYSIFLRNWLKYFPREQIHLVNGNEISKLLNLPKKPKCYPKLYYSRESGKGYDKCRKFRRSRKMVYGRQFRCNPETGFYCIKQQQKDAELHCLTGGGKVRSN